MKRTVKTLKTGLRVAQNTSNGVTKIVVQTQSRSYAFNRAIAAIF